MEDQKNIFNKSVNKSIKLDNNMSNSKKINEHMDVSKENEEGKEDYISEEYIRKTIGNQILYKFN